MTKVSVIIPTYNEENVIGDCLESLSKQTYKDLEVIVVDDGSIDRTLDVISTIHYSLFSIHLLAQKHLGPGAARNFGASRAKGDILVFVDSDMTFSNEFLENLVEPIVKGKTNGTFSKLEYVKNPDSTWSRSWGINEGWVSGMRHPKNYPDKQKVFRAILKKEFDKVSGFSETGYTDDWTLSQKLGYEADNTKAIFYHKNPETLSEVFKQAKWIGKRQYKLGKIGTLVALIRSSLPISIMVGLYKSIVSFTPSFLIFKLIYDLGVFIGALSVLLGGNNAK